MLLVLAVIASVCLDFLNTVFNPSAVVAPLKGLVLLLVVLSFRTLQSYTIVAMFFGVFAARELNLLLTLHQPHFWGDVTYLLRILFFITWLLLFYEKRDRKGFLHAVLAISIFAAVTNFVCQLCGLLFHVNLFRAYVGFGRGGYKGIFLSENDTGVFFLVSLVYALFLWRKGIRLYAMMVLTGLVLLGLGSKTALFGAVLVPVIYFFFMHSFRSPLSFRTLVFFPRVALWWMAVISVGGTTAYLAVHSLSEALTFIKYDQLLRIYEESGLVSSLLSFRDLKVAGYFQSIHSFGDVLFGVQIHDYVRRVEVGDPGVFMYEIDLFDYLARVGLIGVLLTVGLIWRSAALRRWRSRTPEVKTLIVTILLLGCTVGHTLISSMNGVWIGFWLVALGGTPACEDAPRLWQD